MSLRIDETAVTTLNKTAIQLYELALQISDCEKALVFAYGKNREHLGRYNDSIEALIQSLLSDDPPKSIPQLAQKLHKSSLLLLDHMEQIRQFLIDHSKSFPEDMLP
jgi:hypothetical protein